MSELWARQAVVPALMVSTLLVAVGCGGDGASVGSSGGSSGGTAASTTADAGPATTEAQVRDPLTVLRDAVAATRDAGSARVAARMVLDAGELSADTPAEGVADWAGDLAAWEVDMIDPPIPLADPATPAEQLRMRVVEQGDALHVSLPVTFALYEIAAEWLLLDARGPVADYTGDPRLVHIVPLAARVTRPDLGLAIVEAARVAREIGPATVRGKPTTRYTVELDPLPLLRAASLMFMFGYPKEAAELAEVEQVAAEAMTADVWIDELGRVRKVQLTGDLAVAAPHFGEDVIPAQWEELRAEWEFFDYGAEVSVEVPTDPQPSDI